MENRINGIMNGLIAVAIIIAFAGVMVSTDNHTTVENVVLTSGAESPKEIKHNQSRFAKRAYGRALKNYLERKNRRELPMGLELEAVKNHALKSMLKLALVALAIIAIFAIVDSSGFAVIGAVREWTKNPPRMCKMCNSNDGSKRTPVCKNEPGGRVRIWVHANCAAIHRMMPVNERGREVVCHPETADYEINLTERVKWLLSKEQNNAARAYVNGGEPTPAPAYEVEAIPPANEEPTAAEVAEVERVISTMPTTQAGDELWHLIKPSSDADMIEQFKALEERMINEFGGMPTPTIIQGVDSPEAVELGVVHESFDELLNKLRIKDSNGRNFNILIVGPAGVGKTHLIDAVCKALASIGEDAGGFGDEAVIEACKVSPIAAFVSCSADLEPIDLLGSKTPKIGGDEDSAPYAYEKSKSVESYENGGLCLWDEMDALDGAAGLAFNAALAGDRLPLPDGNVALRHPDFRFVGIANTFGKGASSMYSGRQTMDAAFRNRFIIIEMGYSATIERHLLTDANGVFDRDLYDALNGYRELMVECSIREIISTRQMMVAHAFKHSGLFTHEQAIDATFIGWAEADLQRIGRRVPQAYQAPIVAAGIGFFIAGNILMGILASVAAVVVLMLMAYDRGQPSPHARSSVVKANEMFKQDTHLIIADNVPAILAAVDDVSEAMKSDGRKGPDDCVGELSSSGSSWYGRDISSGRISQAGEILKAPYLPLTQKVIEAAESLREYFDELGLVTITRSMQYNTRRGAVKAGRLLNGVSKYRRGRKKAVTTSSGVLELVVDIGGNAGVDAGALAWRAAVGVAACEALEERGYRVALWGASYGRSSYSSRKGELVMWQVKRADDVLSVDVAANALSPLMFRAIIFGAMFLVDDCPTSGLGSSIPLTDEIARFVTGNPNAATLRANVSGDGEQAKQAALKSMKNVLKGLGAIQTDKENAHIGGA